jgi:uncharacterized protein (DUF924 family)
MSNVRPDIRPRNVLDFWLKDTPSAKWFANDPALDAQIRSRFEDAWRLGCAGGLEDWESEPNGALALIILFDQFPRNMFRGSHEAFASDSLAREIAKRAIAEKRDLEVPAALRSFFYLPFSHSENLADQETCVQLNRERLGENDVSYRFALMHRDAIKRFGRFPARNKALGRTNTPEEQEFLNHNPRGF